MGVISINSCAASATFLEYWFEFECSSDASTLVGENNLIVPRSSRKPALEKLRSRLLAGCIAMLFRSGALLFGSEA